MKKVLLLLVALALISCEDTSGSGTGLDSMPGPGSGSDKTYKVPIQYQGNWFYAHSGKDIYLGSQTDLILEYTDPNIITVKGSDTNYHLVREASSTIRLFGSLANLSTKTQSIQSIGNNSAPLAIGGLEHIVGLVNKNDEKFHDNTTADSDGNFMFDGIPNGSYELDVDGTKLDIGNITNSENDIGVITLRDGNACNLKASITMDKPFIYGNNEIYKGNIHIKNVGKQECLGLGYDISPVGNYVNSFDYDPRNAAGTLTSQMTKNIPIQISFNQLDTTEKVVALSMTINDVHNNKWIDRVSLVVFRTALSLDFKSTPGRSVRGYILVPDYGLVKISGSSNMLIPELPDKDYIVTLSNPDLTGEAFYSIGINANAKELSEITSTVDGSNNDTDSAILIPLEGRAEGYLHKGDIDTYKLFVKNTETHRASELFIDGISKFNDTTGNNDGLLNKGETAKFDLGIGNNGQFTASAVTTELLISDPYVTITKNTSICSDTSVTADAKVDTSGNPERSSAYLNNGWSSGCFEVTALNTTPDNHVVTVAATMTDKYYNVWTDTFTITVTPIDAVLSVDGISPFYETTGNNDGFLNKGETAKFDVGISNGGSSSTQTVVTTLSLTDDYVTISRNTSGCYDSNIAANGKIDTDGNPGTSSYYLNRQSSSGCFTATASNATPDNHAVTVTATMTDKYNNVWTDTFTITVVPVDAVLSVDSISPFYETTGNNDGFLNKGETGKFDVGIANGGSSSTQTVVTTLSLTDDYVTISRNASGCYDSDISANSKIDTDGNPGTSSYYLNRQSSSGCFTATALNTTPDNYVVTVTATMTDKYNNVWTDTFNITVTPTNAVLSVDGISPFYETSTIQRNGLLNKGETANFDVGIKNDGSSSTQTVVTTLSLTDDYVTITRNSPDCLDSNISANGKIDTDGSPGTSSHYLNRQFDGCFKATALDTTPDNHVVTVTATMIDKYDNRWTDTFNITVHP